MANSATATPRDLKNSGISYTIRDYGVEYADKITTIGTSIYPLVDIHNIDWDSSVVQNVSNIPDKLFNMYCSEIAPTKDNFVNLNKVKFNRKRYIGDKYYNNVGSTEPDDSFSLFIPPTWYTRGEHPTAFTESTETLDLVDYLTFVTTYTFNLVDTLYDMQGMITPVLRFLRSIIEEYHGLPDENNDVVTYPISMIICPNQTDKNYATLFTSREIQTFTDYRAFNLQINAYQGSTEIKISDSHFYLDIDGNTRLKISEANQSTSPFASILPGAITTTSTGSDLSNKTFTAKLITTGWEPKTLRLPSQSGVDELFGWDDTRTSNIMFYTAATTAHDSVENQYSESKPLNLRAVVKKDPNVFEYIFINDTRYFYLDENYFNTCNSAGASEYQNRAYIISQYDLSKPFNEMRPEDFFNENNLHLKLICVSCEVGTSNDARTMLISNGKILNFEIYPRYYKESIIKDGNAIYCGERDSQLNTTDKTIEAKAQVIDTKYMTDAKKAFDDVRDCTRILDGIERHGFTTSIIITQEIKKPERCTPILISTSPTYFVGGMRFLFRCVCSDSWPVFFIDKTRKFEPKYWLYDGILTGDKNPYIKLSDKYQSVGLVHSEIKHYCGKGYVDPTKDKTIPNKFVWDLALPIYTWRSWSNLVNLSDGEQRLRDVTTPTILSCTSHNNSILPNPGAAVDISKSIFKTALLDNLNVEENFLDFLPGTLYDRNYPPGMQTGYRYKKGYPSLIVGAIYNNSLEMGDKLNIMPINALLRYYTTSTDTGNYNSIDVSNELMIDFAATYNANKDFLEQCNKDFKDKVKNQTTDESKGKVFCSRYCGLTVEKISTEKNAYTINLVLYKPTIPDNFICSTEYTKDYENDSEYCFNLLNTNNNEQISIENQNIIDNRKNPFRLILIIPEKTQSSNNSEFLHEKAILEVNLFVSRADTELAGWASRMNSATYAGKINEIIFGKTVAVKNLVSSKYFVSEGSASSEDKPLHNIQTRLTTDFVPKHPETKIEYNGKIYYEMQVQSEMHGTLIPIYYVYTGGKIPEITFYSESPLENNVWRYKIDTTISMNDFPGNMQSDEIFKGVYGDSVKRLSLSFSREKINYISSEDTYSPKGINNNNIEFTQTGSGQDIGNVGVVDSKTIGMSTEYFVKPKSIDDLKNLKINVFTNFLNILSDKFDKIYGTNDVASISLMSVTGKASTASCEDKNHIMEVESGSFKEMWQSSPFTEVLNNVFNQTDTYYNKTLNKKEYKFNTTSQFNKFYYDSADPVDITTAIIFNDKTISFKEDLINKLKSETKYQSLRLRVLGVLPMTDKYRGFLYDVKFIIKLPR